MPYKDAEQQKSSQASYFQANKARLNEKKRQLRAEWRQVIREAKAVPCKDCGKPYPHYVMDLDHRPGSSKTSQVGVVGNFSSLAKLKEEIAKCDVVCANCHRERTFRRLED